MKTLLLILLLTQSLEWKHIPEASGMTNSGLRINTYVAQIARDGDNVKFWLRMDFPDGTPQGIVAFTFDSVKVEAKFDCKKKTVKAKSKGYFYLNDELIKTLDSNELAKAPHGSIGHYVLEAFCEQGSKPTKPPTLKP